MNAQTTTISTRGLAVGESVTVTIEARQFWNDTGIHLVAGQECRFTTAGTWTDWYIPCDADGFPSPNLLMRAFEWLRRAPHEPWFALIGGIDHDLRSLFLIGTERTLTAPVSGMLTCFANDLPLAYWNNLGSVQLTVTRMR
jgi:hypothetical protein